MPNENTYYTKTTLKQVRALAAKLGISKAAVVRTAVQMLYDETLRKSYRSGGGYAR